MRDGGKRWYVVNTHPGREYCAKRSLDARGFAPFLPEAVQRKRYPSGAIYQHRGALFPNYLFIELDLAIQGWRAIDETFGVAGILRYQDDAGDERPLPVPADVMAEIQRRVQNGGGAVSLGALARREVFRKGQRLRVEGGPLEGLTGLFVVGSKKRVQLLLDMLPVSKVITLPVELVSPA